MPALLRLTAAFPMRAIRLLLLVLAPALAGTAPAFAQMSAPDLMSRLETMESQMRQLTGQIEQLQFRNQQLEQQVRRMQQESALPGAAPSAQPARPQPPLQQAAPPAAPQTAPGRRSDTIDQSDGPSPIRPMPSIRRSDVFDPSANPNAPGVPRPLGSLPAGQASANPPPIMTEEPPPVGARGGREPGSPLDLSTLSGNAPNAGSALPPRGNAGVTGAVASVAPAQAPQSAKDEFDLAYEHIQAKDYALAEQGFREFLRKYPSDRLNPEAQYWLGESLFQRQRYRDAAESFLAVSTKYDTSAKAPDSLLRLGQSLAELGEKNAACATLGEISRKYPRASLGVKRGAEREQKRVSC
jgi:tol-pal system protein YbgF